MNEIGGEESKYRHKLEYSIIISLWPSDQIVRIIHLQSLANNLSDAFTDSKRLIKSHIPAANAPEK